MAVVRGGRRRLWYFGFSELPRLQARAAAILISLPILKQGAVAIPDFGWNLE